MIYIIGIVVLLAILGALWTLVQNVFEFLLGMIEIFAKEVGGIPAFVVTVLSGIVAYFVFSWKGVLVVIAVGFGGGLLLVKLKEIALINQKTKYESRIHKNEILLQQELYDNCRFLGYMDSKRWIRTLPNYSGREYKESFEKLVMGFAEQLEREYLIQSLDWIKPFLLYLGETTGATVQKMLVEVACRELGITHVTPDGEIVRNVLDVMTQSQGLDSPAILQKTLVEKDGEKNFIYKLSPYGRIRLGVDVKKQPLLQEEIEFDDL